MTTQVDIRGNIAQAEAIQVNSVNLTTVHTLAEVDQLCLRTLRCANALVVKNKLKENKDKLLYDLIAWVFQDRQYLSWQDGEKISLLWIKGGAGRGKTMISIGLVDRLLRRQNDSTMVAYFFCQNANYELNTLESVIKGLIQQLVFKQQGLQIALRRRWDCLKNRFEEDTTSWRVLWDILLEMLEGCTCQRVYIIVDALDECRDDDKTDFLKLIVRTGLHNPAKIKWLLTSRPLHSADRELLTGNDQAQVSLELNLQHISEAVKTYVAFKVAELDRRHNYGKELRRKLEAVLNEKAESTYLWVSLVCKNLEGVHRDDALSTIQEMPPGLPSLYHRSCTQLRNRESVDAKNCIRLLKVMMLAYRPLHSSEVGSVTGITDSVLRIDALVDKCASLINMRGTIIDFVHQSARDYLSSGDGKALLDSHEDYGNGHVALSCLFFLSAELRFNICELPRLDSTGKLTEEMKDPKECALLASMEYAATFWAQHLEGDSNTLLVQNALTERGEVSRFLQAKFLEWLECLSLLDKQEMAIEVLKTMSRVAESAPFVSTFVQDATHFLVRHYHTIANWPLQIYSSATVFSPERSIVKRENLDKLPKWLKQIPRMDNDWSSVIHSMGGHSDKVKAVAFSPSGKRIASGSHDETIKIWDARTGVLEKTLAGHSDWVYAVAFSPDGKHIVSGSDDNTIKFWEIATGKLLKTLTGHSDCVSTVVFSPDGKHIASGSHDGTIKLWDTKTRNLSKTLAGHSGRVNSVAFSLDCKHIASGSADNTIKLWDTVSGALKKTLACHSDWVNAVAFSPDGKHIASGSGDNTIKIWDIATGNLWKIIDSHSDCVNTVAFSPDGKHIVSGSDDNTVRLWDAATTSLQKTLVGHSDWVNAVAFSPDGNHLVSGSNDNTIKLWDTMIRGLHKTQVGHSDYVTTLSLSPDARYVASGSHDSSVKLWDARSGALQKTFAGHLDALNAVDFSPDGMHIASASNDSTIRLWESVTGALEKTLAGHSDWVNAVAFSPDGKHIVSGSDDNTIKFWEVATGKLLKTLTGHSDCVSTVVFSPDGKQIASGSADNTIKIWDIATGNLWKTIDSHSDCVNTVAFSPDGKHIASGSGDDTVRLWDAATTSLQKTLVGHSSWVNAIAFSPDGNHIASASKDKTVKIWDAVKGAIEKTLAGHSDDVTSVSFSPNNKHITSGSYDRTIKLWDTQTGALRKTLLGHSHYVTSVTVSPDSKYIMSGSTDRTVKLWDAVTGTLQKAIGGHSAHVNIVAFSPDNKWIASGSHDETIKIWDARTGALEKTLAGHSDWVYAVAFSPDGKHIVSGSDDNTIKFWEIATGKLLKTLTGHSGCVSTVVFSPDGKHIASGSHDGTIKLWDTKTRNIRKTLAGHSDCINVVAFSPDNRYIVSGSADMSIRLWDIAECLGDSTFFGKMFGHLLKFRSSKEVKTLDQIINLRYSDDSGYLTTNIGPVRIDHLLSASKNIDLQSVEDLWVRDQWIYYGSSPILRVPFPFEPRCYDTHDNRLAIGFQNGQILCFEIDRARLRLAFD